LKYVHRPAREASEAPYLSAVFSKHFEPFGQLTIGAGARLGHGGSELVAVAGHSLAIHAESASWAFLSPAEARLYRAMDGMAFGELAAAWPGDAAGQVEDFTAQLYRRGLLTLEGHTAVDRRMFADGPNYDEGHLVELLLTEKCNLACPYCLAGASQAMPSMDADLGRRAIDLAFAMTEAHTLAFEFAGGEPLLKFDLLRSLVDYIENHAGRAGRRVFLSLQTNATLITEERAAWLKRSGIQVGISLDGGAQAQNLGRPQVNGKPSHGALMRGIDLLQKHDVRFGALVVLNRNNIGDPEGLAEFLLAHRIHGFRLNPVAYLGDARKNWATVGLEQADVIDFFRRLTDIIVHNRLLLLEDNLHTMCLFLTSKQRRTRCARAECGAGDSFQAIAANGDIYPCGRATQTPAFKLGNVWDKDIDRLSAPARGNEHIQAIRTRRPADFDTCRVCAYRQLCQAGCSAQSYESYGTVRHKTPECDFYKTLYPELMHRLAYDAAAFEHLNASNYFEGEGVRFDHDFLHDRMMTAL
jgi:uncharacterized protein